MWLSLLHITRPELGHTIEKDGSRAGAPDKHTVGMHLFVERGIQGGISMVSKRYRKANNLLVLDYNPSKPNSYIMYLDPNNLYG